MTRIVLALVALPVVALAGCGGEETEAGAAAGGDAGVAVCAPGELMIEDGSCRAAGLPPDLPAAGPSAPPQAGVPDGACYEGFASDGEGGCTAIVPPAVCGGGMMAIPGDSACREVAPCGTGTWGMIPLESGAEFVDESFTGQSDGTANAPWKTVQAAIDAAAPGDMVAIAAGTYDESLVIADKAVRLWGRCPALVAIAGVVPVPGSVMEIARPDVEVHTLALTGLGIGVYLFTGGALLDRLWIHDTEGAGVLPTGGGETTELHDSLIERTPSSGIIVEGSAMVVARTEVDDPQLASDGYRGFSVQGLPDPDTDAPSTTTITQCHLHHSKDYGIVSYGGALEVRGTLVRNTKPLGSYQAGFGLLAVAPSSSTVVVGSVFASSTRVGVVVSEGSASISTTTIEDTEAWEEDGYGVGIAADLGATLELTESMVRDNIGAGAGLYGAEARFVRTVVQRTASNVVERYGSGVGIEAFQDGNPSLLELEESVIAESAGGGVYLVGSDLTMRQSIVRATEATATYAMGPGVVGEMSIETERPASLAITNSLIEESRGAGVSVLGGSLELVSSVVRDTRPSSLGAGGLGVGVGAVSPLRSEGRIYGSIVEKSHQAGIGVSGSELDLEATLVRDVLPEESSGDLGVGVHLEPSDTEGRSRGQIRWSLVEGVHHTGIFAWSADLELHGVLVRDVAPAPAGDGEAFGVAAAAGPERADPSRVLVVGSHVERAVAAGILSDASELSVTGTLVRDIVGRSVEADFGYGIFAQHGASLEVADSLVERTERGGIAFVFASGSVENTILRDITSGDEWLGDAILASQSDVTLRDLLVERPKRAGVSAFAARVTMSGLDLVCAQIDIDAETVDGVGSQFSDLGDNHCGCPAPDGPCEAASAGVAPPEALD